MSVYVIDSWEPCHGNLASRLEADTEVELHEFARKIGVNGHWFINNRSGPHYRLIYVWHQKAIEAGATLETASRAARRRAEARRRQKA